MKIGVDDDGFLHRCRRSPCGASVSARYIVLCSPNSVPFFPSSVLSPQFALICQVCLVQSVHPRVPIVHCKEGYMTSPGSLPHCTVFSK